eukprot:649150-Hanusia_phi.AAC.1
MGLAGEKLPDAGASSERASKTPAHLLDFLSASMFSTVKRSSSRRIILLASSWPCRKESRSACFSAATSRPASPPTMADLHPTAPSLFMSVVHETSLLSSIRMMGSAMTALAAAIAHRARHPHVLAAMLTHH